MPTLLQVHLLGEFQLVHGDAPVTAVVSARVRAWVARLVLHPGVPQRRARLAALCSPDSPDAQGRTNLRKVVHDLCGAGARPEAAILCALPARGGGTPADPLESVEQLAYERTLATTRAELGATGWATALAERQALAPEDAIASAWPLSSLDAPRHSVA